MRQYSRYGIALLAAMSGASAYADTPVAPPTAAQTQTGANEGVVSYPAGFFADARPGTAYDMILRLPGFSFDGGAQVRGFAGAGGNVLIDGERPTTKQDDLQSVLKRIPAGQVDHIDLIRGGAPGIDMQGRTVIANIIRKKGGGVQGVASVSNNTAFNDGRNVQGVRLEWSKREDGKSIEAAINSGRFIDNGEGSGPHKQTNSAGTDTYLAHLAGRGGGGQTTVTAAYAAPLAGGKFRINGLLYSDFYLVTETNSVTLPAGGGGDDAYREKPTSQKAELGLHYSRDFGSKTALEMLAIQQVQRKADHFHYAAAGDDEYFSQSRTIGESILRGSLRYQASDKLTFEVAAEGAYNTQGTDVSYFINGADQFLPAHVQVAEKRGEVAASFTWSPSPKYTVEGGVRAEASNIHASGDTPTQSKNLFYPKPRLVFTWSPDKADQLRLRLEREVGQLDFDSFVASASTPSSGGVHLGNTALLPQDVWVAEAAYERRFWTSGDATLTFRHSEINDAVDRVVGSITDPNPPHAITYFDEPGNIGKGREDDLIANLSLPLDNFWIKNGLIKATWTWRKTEVTDPATLTQRPVTQLHPSDGEIHFTQDLAKLKSTWGVDAYAPWTETYYRYNEIDTYHWGVNYTLFYEYKPTSKLSLRTEFQDNLTGFDATRDFYSSPRNISPTPYKVDIRHQRVGPTLYFRLRKMFG
jgi:hypothetical protein